MSVKRYECGMTNAPTEYQYPTMHQDANGGYVSYEDYAALEARYAALAAELSAVETIHNDAVFITDEHYGQCPPEVQKMIRSLVVLQIPPYQAFLAEVRAQGVDMFAKYIALYNSNSEQHAHSFAAQLRKGGA